jgi:hypothetical protein
VDRIQPGIESLSTAVLRRMDKGVDALHNVRLLKYAKEYGVAVTWNIILGTPGETGEDIDGMTRRLPALTHFDPPSLTRLRLDRFSPYHERPADYGLTVTGPAPFYRYLHDLPAGELARIAYFFTYRTTRTAPSVTYARLNRAVAQWHEDHPGADFVHRRGPGFTILEDTRGPVAVRRVLRGREEETYHLLADGGTRTSVNSALGEGKWEPEEWEELLKRWGAEGLVFTDGGRALALSRAMRSTSGREASQ